MELLFHGSGSKSDVLWCGWGEENPERIAADLREGKTATLQRSRDHQNCNETFLGMPYAIVSAHSRHIQQSCYLDESRGRWTSQIATWNRSEVERVLRFRNAVQAWHHS